ncbi:MAG: CAP domain-containing protein [Solirubrobacteraceae bacterium]
MLVGVALIAGLACPNAAVPPTLANLPDERRALICLVNIERTRRHLKALHENAALDSIAQLHDEEMASHNYASHTGRDGSTSTSRIKSGYVGKRRFFLTGEDIGFGGEGRDTPLDIVTGWMGSAVHRGNLLRSGFRDGGVGIAPSLPPVLGLGTAGAIYTLDFGYRKP